MRSLQRRRDSVLRSLLTFRCKGFTLSLSNEAPIEQLHFGLRKRVNLHLLLHLFFAVLLVKLFSKTVFKGRKLIPCVILTPAALVRYKSVKVEQLSCPDAERQPACSKASLAACHGASLQHQGRGRRKISRGKERKKNVMVSKRRPGRPSLHLLVCVNRRHGTGTWCYTHTYIYIYVSPSLSSLVLIQCRSPFRVSVHWTSPFVRHYLSLTDLRDKTCGRLPAAVVQQELR